MAPRKAPARKSTRVAVTTRGKTVAEAAKAADDAKAARGADHTASALAGGPVAPAPKVEDASAAARNAKAEVEASVRRDEEKGYHGQTFDPNPNEAYSLLTGPDAPPVNPPRS